MYKNLPNIQIKLLLEFMYVGKIVFLVNYNYVSKLQLDISQEYFVLIKYSEAIINHN